MQKKFLILLSSVGLLFAGVDVQVQLNVSPPDILFPVPPPVVPVIPGIFVVPDYPEEVFFVSGSYWMAREGRWFRSYGPRKKWVLIRDDGIPPGLLKIRHGVYRNWHPEKREHGDDQGDGGYKQKNKDHGHGRGHGHD